MADFINFEVSVEDEVQEEENEVSDSDSLSSFIDNEETEDDVNFYRNFDNVETDIEKNDFDEISNLCESSEGEA